jgi:cell wall-associated NlpC family hydrolase
LLQAKTRLLLAVLMSPLLTSGNLALAAVRLPLGPVQQAPEGAQGAALGRRAAALAQRLIGIPYQASGSSPTSGFDCSGLVYFVYQRLGVQLPRSSFGQVQSGTAVAREQLRPGDLVFFADSSHVGLYIGGGRFVHAPHTGARVQIASLDDGWYGSEYEGARRISG